MLLMASYLLIITSQILTGLTLATNVERLYHLDHSYSMWKNNAGFLFSLFLIIFWHNLTERVKYFS